MVVPKLELGDSEIPSGENVKRVGRRERSVRVADNKTRNMEKGGRRPVQQGNLSTTKGARLLRVGHKHCQE
jgi:hypothetical protein